MVFASMGGMGMFTNSIPLQKY